MFSKSSLVSVVALTVLTSLSNSWGAACCGGSSSSAALITGDDKLLFGTSFAVREVHSQALPQGDWIKRDDHEVSRDLGLQVAKLLSDRWQTYGSILISNREHRSPDQSALHQLSDLSLGVGYEVWPEWDYNSRWPKGILTLGTTLPTGRAIEDLGPDEQWAATGKGTPTVNLGLQLLKSRGRWDYLLTPEIKRTLEKQFTVQDQSITLASSWGLGATAGLGHTEGDWRLGTTLGFTYEEARESSSAIYSGASLQRWMTWTCAFSYMGFKDQTVSLAWMDQTLFGAPLNSNLSRGLTLTYQTRTPR